MRYLRRSAASAGGVKISSSVRGSGALTTSGLALSDIAFLPDGLAPGAHVPSADARVQSRKNDLSKNRSAAPPQDNDRTGLPRAAWHSGRQGASFIGALSLAGR